MVRSNAKPKRVKPVETTEEFVKRMNRPTGKINGLKQNLKRARR